MDFLEILRLVVTCYILVSVFWSLFHNRSELFYFFQYQFVIFKDLCMVIFTLQFELLIKVCIFEHQVLKSTLKMQIFSLKEKFLIFYLFFLRSIEGFVIFGIVVPSLGYRDFTVVFFFFFLLLFFFCQDSLFLLYNKMTARRCKILFRAGYLVHIFLKTNNK